MREPRSSLSALKWRRTAFARIDGAVDIAEDDWSLRIDGMSAARIVTKAAGSLMTVAERLLPPDLRGRFFGGHSFPCPAEPPYLPQSP
jgi:hypothetical protein